MRKPQFGLVMGLLLIFFTLALMRAGLEKYIPLLPPNRLANLPGAFLRTAVHQPVDWQPEPAAALQKAGQLNRPCLFVVGLSSSGIGKLMDQRVFVSLPVAKIINALYVPVRIDLAEDPKWSTPIFPLSRMKVQFLTGYQVFILDSKGQFIRFFDPPDDGSKIDPSQFIDALIAARKTFDENQKSQTPLVPALIQQQDELELAGSSTLMVPPYQAYVDALARNVSSQNGTFSEGGYARAFPFAWLYFSRTGHRQTLRDTLGRFLLSPEADLFRGGFFGIGESGDGTPVDIGQRTGFNAQMAALLAEAGSGQGSPMFTQFGQRTFDMLVRDLQINDLFVDGRPSDMDLITNRSAAASYTLDRLSNILNSDEMTWATKNLNLNRFENPQHIPYLSTSKSALDPMFAQVAEKVADSEDHSAGVVGQQYLDVNGETVAALARCTRIWGDSIRFNRLKPSAAKLDRFVSSFGVVHTLGSDIPSGYLNDYLAYANSQLQLYLCTGEDLHFEQGKMMLNKAITLFFDPNAEQFLSISAASKLQMPPHFVSPELCDELHESSSAEAIRLCIAYGRMTEPSEEGTRLLKIASDSIGKYTNLSVSLTPGIAAYFLAASNLTDPICAFTVGPEAQEKADALFRLRPSRLVCAASQTVRPDLAKKAPGIYLVSGSLVSGPFSVAQAANLMPLDLQIGVNPEITDPNPLP